MLTHRGFARLPSSRRASPVPRALPRQRGPAPSPAPPAPVQQSQPPNALPQECWKGFVPQLSLFLAQKPLGAPALRSSRAKPSPWRREEPSHQCSCMHRSAAPTGRSSTPQHPQSSKHPCLSLLCPPPAVHSSSLPAPRPPRLPLLSPAAPTVLSAGRIRGKSAIIVPIARLWAGCKDINCIETDG